MEVCEVQQDAIKDLYGMIEGIACSIPFTSKHEWQNRMLQRKLQREMDRQESTPPKFYDDESSEAGV